MMKKHLKYLSYVMRHKWFVLVAGRKVGASWWRLLVHDWSKFSPAEWGPYVEYFYGGRDRRSVQPAFDAAWLHHQHRNPHHWQAWVLRMDSGETLVINMPEKYIREMVADWMGAGRAITGKWEAAAWYEKNKAKMLLSEYTRQLVEYFLNR